jgi:pyridoxine 4-dehydrogenase
MTVSATDAGTVRLAGREVPRLGFGAMRLPGPGVWGPPPDRDRAIAVCRRAVELGVRVIDTAWYYGTPDQDVANEVLAEALRPYPDDLVFVTKLGGRRTDDAGWAPALRPEQLREGCERDLRVLGVESVPVAHLRWIDDGGPDVVPFAEALGTMLELRDEGKIGAIGLSNVDVDQVRTAERITEVATVSNLYSPLQRDDDPLVDHCTGAGIPYLPFFPLAIGSVADPGAVADVADGLGATPAQVALAWLLHRSPWMLPIPGTGDPAHLEENLGAGSLRLPDEAVARLDAAGRPSAA